jgi:glyoxylase-like metal-dependent hydrolase (beta-lactamase superfamily II)
VKLSDELYVLPLPVVRDGQTNYLNLALVLDQTEGPTLIDAGLPGQEGAVAEALAPLGLRVEQLRRIILTHQDLDHVGSLAALARASGARVLAHRVEAPAIDGSQTPRFAAPEVLAQRPEMRAVAEQFQPTPVDELLEDGTRLDLGGGLVAVFTPGHSPGHTSLYHEPTKTLITGDALTSNHGVLHGPNPGFTPDMAGAARSARKLAGLDVRTIVCYHGGVVSHDAGGQLRRVAQELAHLT